MGFRVLQRSGGLQPAGDARLKPGATSGLVSALNLGLAAARAPLIARMDADDVMHPERLEAQIDLIERSFDLVATQVEVFPEPRAGYREYIRWQNGVVTPEQIDASLYAESPFARRASIRVTRVRHSISSGVPVGVVFNITVSFRRR
ncbi:MAG TPA: glycosyltransferase [Thermoanaerobaculia bacterium]|nr:glycosyltransferase [Thermoanaerobaculia bacterium]